MKSKERIEEIVFLGTEAEEQLYYNAVAKQGLTDEEKFVLLRYLDLVIPANLRKYAILMEDEEYQKALSKILDRLPSEAKSKI